MPDPEGQTFDTSDKRTETMILRDFTLAPNPEDEPTGYTLRERPDGTDETCVMPRNDAFEVLAHTSLHTDLEDICDPVLTTYVVRFTAAGWLHALTQSISEAKDPDAKGHEPISVERHATAYLSDYFQPYRCYCQHDCCGHRHGYAEAKHIVGAVFAVAVHTSRNY